MNIELLLNGAGDLPPVVDSPAVPVKGDEIECQHIIYKVEHVRYLIENGAIRILVVTKRSV
jgi:hypothetical protein